MFSGEGRGPETTNGLVYIWDTSALLHAGRADRLDVLGDLVSGPAATPWTHQAPAAVVEELARHAVVLPDWMHAVHVDGLSEIVALGAWVQRLASGSHNLGESTVAAWAESHGAIAIIDDNDARKTMNRYGLDAHGSAWLLCQSVLSGCATVPHCSSYFDAVLADGARLPFGPGGFPVWAQDRRLLLP